MEMNPFLITDWYKIGHPFQYPKGTITVYSNLTARKSRMQGVDQIVVFGLQHFCKEFLIDYFNRNFFSRPKEIVIAEYKRRIRTSLGSDLPSYQHIEDIWELGYLPVEIKALPEGTVVDMRIPVLTIKNTLPKFFWVTNFLETLMSCETWQAMTSATIAFQYRKLLTKYAILTGMPLEFVKWQGHDFSMRGMGNFMVSAISDAAHLLSFTGSDTIPGIELFEQYYGADADKEIIAGSVPATEHAVMCAGTGVEGEFATFKRLITEIYPNGVISIVSDTFNLWDVIRPKTGFLARLKKEVMARNGKVVIRPDSGDPVKILTGYTEEEVIRRNGKIFIDEAYKTGFKTTGREISVEEFKGVVELLWDEFGGTITSTGHKLLDSHIGAIYGDSITLARAEEICQRLMDKGFASQVVFGIGSFTYQYNTRDTFGFAIKATAIEIMRGIPDEVGNIERYKKELIEIFKDPITDDGTKKSAKGLLKVEEEMIFNLSGHPEHSKYVLVDQVSWEEEAKGALKTVFKDGKMIKEHTLSEIRNRLESFLKFEEAKSFSYI